MSTATGTDLPTDLYDVIARRRDTRAEFSGDPVAPEVLDRVLSAAHAAPSVGLSQPWDFVLVRDPATLGAFADHVAEQRTAYAEVLRREQPDRSATFDPIKIDGVRESGLGVVVTYDPERGGPHVLGRHTVDETGLFSAVLAVQNLWLAATAEGLGVGWVSFYREDVLRDLVGAPAPVRPVAWLCLGALAHQQSVPDLERHGWRRRRPLSDAVHYETYDAARRLEQRGA